MNGKALLGQIEHVYFVAGLGSSHGQLLSNKSCPERRGPLGPQFSCY